jgi:hypothetical protein
MRPSPFLYSILRPKPKDPLYLYREAMVTERLKALWRKETPRGNGALQKEKE